MGRVGGTLGTLYLGALGTLCLGTLGSVLDRVDITEYKLSVSTTKSSVAEGGQNSPAGIVFLVSVTLALQTRFP